MILYQFKTFRTSYFFPSPKKEYKFLYNLYTPYGGKLSKFYWWLFRHCYLVRSVNRVNIDNANSPIARIIHFCPKGCVMSFNMGTPGPEQKISCLGIGADKKRFFAKYSEKEGAKTLSRNEIRVLSLLKGSGLTPELYDYHEDKEYIFFRTSCVSGHNPVCIQLNNDLIALAININKIQLNDNQSNGLLSGLSHGDFTPWNVLIDSGTYRMIDWEMADIRELGYDVFTYITHVNALINQGNSLNQAIKDNKDYIDYYFKEFGVLDWQPYLKAFVQRRINYEIAKGNTEHAKKFEELI